MPVELVIAPHRRELGPGLSVLRVLPAARRMMVGPFIFLDQMGPIALPPGAGLDVRPHPHIGLATVTYLYEGTITHRDSLGCVQDIRPGDVNWMVAGRGIVHSERSPPEARAPGARLLGLQCWVALPMAEEECDPSFHHHPAASLPGFTDAGVEVTLVAGSGFGLVSPVTVQSPLCHARVDLAAGASLRIEPEHAELAVYVVDGDGSVDGQSVGAGSLATLAPGQPARLEARAATRAFVLGGSGFPERRHVSWNFVSSSEGRIERARADWRDYGRGVFPAVPGDEEFIPLPDR